MKIKTLMRHSRACTDLASTERFLKEILVPAFTKTPALKRLDVANDFAKYEASAHNGNTVAASFELTYYLRNKNVSYYGVRVSFSLSAAELWASVSTVHFKDGAGVASKNWELDEDLCEELKAQPDETCAQFATCIKNACVELHETLLTRVGLPPGKAKVAVKQHWLSK